MLFCIFCLDAKDTKNQDKKMLQRCKSARSPPFCRPARKLLANIIWFYNSEVFIMSCVPGSNDWAVHHSPRWDF